MKPSCMYFCYLTIIFSSNGVKSRPHLSKEWLNRKRYFDSRIKETFRDDETDALDDTDRDKQENSVIKCSNMPDVNQFNLDQFLNSSKLEDLKRFRLDQLAMRNALTPRNPAKPIFNDLNNMKPQNETEKTEYSPEDNIINMMKFNNKIINRKRRYEEYIISNSIKQQITTIKHEETYDYNSLKYDYNNYISMESKMNECESKKNKTNVEETVPNQNILIKLLKLINIDFGKRCSDVMYYNINDIICIMNDIKHANTTKDYEHIRAHTIKTIKFWTIVYVVVGVPLWMWKGWCCCCFICKICRTPQTIVEDTEIYIAENPPGKCRQKDGVISYQPTVKENYLCRKLIDQATLQ